MRSTRAVTAAATMLVACAPPLDPSWLVTAPRELAMEIRVTEQGPYGERLGEQARTPRDALPLDTLTLEPVVVSAQGIISADMLEGMWIQCAEVGNCLARTSLGDRPTCDGDELEPPEPCRFADGGRATLPLADFPEDLDPESTSVFDLITGPTIAFVGSPPGGPGLEQCIAHFDARESLSGCLMMERLVEIGPLGELADQLEEMGIDPGLDETAETLLNRPRNRNPAVEEIVVRQGDVTMTVASGDRVTLLPGREIELTVVTSDEDLDSFEALVGDDIVLFSDDLGTQWWFDREIELVDAPLGGLSALWHPAGHAEVRAYVVLRDNRGGEGWGFVDFELRSESAADSG